MCNELEVRTARVRRCARRPQVGSGQTPPLVRHRAGAPVQYERRGAVRRERDDHVGGGILRVAGGALRGTRGNGKQLCTVLEPVLPPEARALVQRRRLHRRAHSVMLW